MAAFFIGWQTDLFVRTVVFEGVGGRAKIAVGLCGHIGKYGVDRDVLRQLLRIDLVERVVRRVVPVEVIRA